MGRDARAKHQEQIMNEPTAPAVTETAAVQPAIPSLTPEQFAALLASMSGTDAAMIDKVGEIADSVKKQRPENVQHPDVSVLNPKGERDHPRPELPCEKVWLGGFPIDRFQSTAEELTLIAQLQPGVYDVERVDGVVEKVPVGFIKDDMGRLSQIRIGLNTGREHRHLWPKLTVILTQIIAQQAAPVAA